MYLFSDLVKNPNGTDFNLCGEFRWSPEGPVSQIHSPHFHDGAPRIFSDHLNSVQMLKGDWDEVNNEPIHPYIVFSFLWRVVYKLSSEVGCGEVTNPK